MNLNWESRMRKMLQLLETLESSTHILKAEKNQENLCQGGRLQHFPETRSFKQFLKMHRKGMNGERVEYIVYLSQDRDQYGVLRTRY